MEPCGSKSPKVGWYTVGPHISVFNILEASGPFVFEYLCIYFLFGCVLVIVVRRCVVEPCFQACRDLLSAPTNGIYLKMQGLGAIMLEYLGGPEFLLINTKNSRRCFPAKDL